MSNLPRAERRPNEPHTDPFAWRNVNNRGVNAMTRVFDNLVNCLAM